MRWQSIIAFVLLGGVFLIGVLSQIATPKQQTAGIKWLSDKSERLNLKSLSCAWKPLKTCDNRVIWITAHFVYYFVLGLLVPGRWLLVVVTIVCWEVFERLAKGPWWDEGPFFHKTIYDILADFGGFLLGTLVVRWLSQR